MDLTAIRHSFIGALPGADNNLDFGPAHSLGDERAGAGTVIVPGSSVVFVEGKGGLSFSGNNEDSKDVGGFLQGFYLSGCQWNDASGLHIPGILINCIAESLHAAALVDGMKGHIVPVVAFREPYFTGRFPVCSRRLAYCRGKDPVPEEVFLIEGIGIIGLRISVVERAADAYARVIGLARESIYVRAQGIAKADGLQHILKVVRIGPYLAFQVCALGGVSLEDGGEYAKLEPAGIHLRVCEALMTPFLHMAAYIVPPVAITYIGCCGSEIGQEFKDAPFVIGVSGEA